MEQEQFQKHMLKRIQKLEEKTFGATYDENYKTLSARQKSQEISSGESTNHFIGERTEESARQRIASFYQNYDKGSVYSLYGDELVQYNKEKAIIEMLVKKYHLQQLQKELIN